VYTFYCTFYDDNKSFIENMVDNDGKKNSLDSVNMGLEDLWLLRRIKYYIKEISNSFDRLKIREALNTALYLMDKDFDWYEKRKYAKIGRLYQNETDVLIIHQFLTKRIKLLSPFCPFLSEELWHKYGNDNSIFNSSWPSIDGELINDSVHEENEIFISNIINDLNKIIRVTKNNSINKVFIYLSSEDKNHLYHEILNILVSQNINKNFGEVMRALLSNSNKDIEKQNIIKNNTDFIKKTIDDILSLTPVDRERRFNIGKFDELEPLYDAVSLLSKEYDVSPENILIYRERQKDIIDPGNKSKFSRPFKPAIFIQ
jgi:leucyl-tRNA synthetase